MVVKISKPDFETQCKISNCIGTSIFKLFEKLKMVKYHRNLNFFSIAIKCTISLYFISEYEY